MQYFSMPADSKNKHNNNSIISFIGKWFLLLSLVPLFVGVAIDYIQTKKLIEHKLREDVSQITSMKAYAVETWFDSRIKESQSLASADTTVETFNFLLENLEKNKDSVASYVNSIAWKKNISKNEATFKNHLNIFDSVNDLLFIDTSGSILYSVRDRLPVGSNLFLMAENTSRIKKQYEQILEKKQPLFLGFDHYHGSFESIEAHISTPVVDNNGEVLGFLVTGLRVDEVFSLLSEKTTASKRLVDEIRGKNKNYENLAEPFKYYLVDEEGRRVGQESSPVYKAEEHTNGLYAVKNTRNIENNKQFYSGAENQNIGYHFNAEGVEVLGVYHNINLGSDVGFSLVAEIAKNSIYETSNASLRKSILLVIVIVLITVLIGFSRVRVIVNAIRGLEIDSKRVADGLQQEYESNTVFREITRLKNAFNYLVKKNETNEKKMLVSKAALEDSVRELKAYKKILDQHSILGVTDIKGDITYINDKFVEISGFSRVELIGSNHRVVNSGEHDKDVFRQMYLTISKGFIWKGELCNRNKDGDLYWVDTTIVPMINENGQPESYISLRTDITERKKAEIEMSSLMQTLDESRNQLEMLINSLDGIFFIVNLKEKRNEYISQQVERIQGLSVDQWKNGGVTSEPSPQVKQLLQTLTPEAPSGEVVHTECNIEGNLIWLRTVITAVFEGQVMSKIIGVSFDLTAQENAEFEMRSVRKELKSSREELDILINSIEGIFFIIDTQAKKNVYISPKVESIVGLTQEQWLNASEEYQNLYEENEAFRNALATLTPENRSVDIVHESETAFGYKWFRSVYTGQFEGEELIQYMGVSFDITKSKLESENKKQMEEQLKQAQKLESIGQLAAGIAHEINTPTQFVNDNVSFLKDSVSDILKLIKTYDELYQKAVVTDFENIMVEKIKNTIEEVDLPYLEAEMPDALDQSLDGIKRIGEIVRAMKEFSHPSGAEKQTVDINHNIRNTVMVASNEWKYCADIEFNLDDSVPMIACYAGELNQVILNIVVNASHAIVEKEQDSGQKGTITISTEAESDAVVVRIGDTGSGMSDEVKEKIFDPFFTTKEVGKGTGQGLSIAYGVIVEKHKGTILVDSVVGEGTTFIIRLPLIEHEKMEQDNIAA